MKGDRLIELANLILRAKALVNESTVLHGPDSFEVHLAKYALKELEHEGRRIIGR